LPRITLNSRPYNPAPIGVNLLNRRLFSHVGLAAAGVFIFLMLVLTSGRIIAGGGLGWDGRGYARIMAEGLEQGSEITRTRPLLPLLTRIPHVLGLDVIPSFQVMNAVYAFTLYLFCSLILDAYGASLPVRALVIANLALSIATSRMFAFYPVQIDLGVLALVTAGFYFVMTDRHPLGGVIAMIAMASREFGLVVVLCGLHRTLRRHQPASPKPTSAIGEGGWRGAVWYLPALAVGGFVRWYTYSEGGLSPGDAVANLTFLLHPAFVTAFAYFAVTVFGGISALLVVRPRWCASRLRREPELASCLLVIVALAAVGNLDVWRYLMFALPVALVLIAQYFEGLPPVVARLTAAATTFVTVITQRPFQRMDQDLYFQDWFPLYSIIPGPPMRDLLTLWAMRLIALVLILILIQLIQRSAVQEQTS
jgi:hypothetical protein